VTTSTAPAPPADSKYLDKILGILALANDPATLPEAAKNYTEQAQRLMTKWGIEEEQLRVARAARGADEPVGDERVWIPYSPYQSTQLQLWQVAAEQNGVQAVLISGAYRVHPDTGEYQKGSWYELFGFETGRTLTKLLAASLTVQAEHEFRTAGVQSRMAAETSHPGHRIRWKNGFVAGFAAGAAAKLARARRETVDATPGSALALVDRDALVLKAVSDKYNKLGKSKSSAGQGSGSAQLEGYLAGKQADVGQTGLGTTGAARGELS
jgi:hypothetical protein